jgi:glycosyltransferase involved in cell wall biosynthesis
VAFVGTELVAALRQLGQAAELIEVPRPGNRLPAPWRRATAPLRLLSPLGVLPRVRLGRYDVVHFHYAWKALAGPLSGRPYVLHCHGTDVRGRTPNEPIGCLIGQLARRAARVYYATPDLAETVRAFRHDAEFLPNPIDLTRFRVAEGAAGDAIPKRDLLVAVRLDATKGLDTMIAVVDRLVKLRPATSITLVDQGPGVARMRSVAGAHAAVRSPVAHEAMAELMRGHLLALGQFRVGALGNTELEALACGVPIAAAFRYPHAYASPPPLVGGGVDDPEATARSLATLLDDEARRGELAADSVAWIMANHAAPTVARRLLSAYWGILEARH